MCLCLSIADGYWKLVQRLVATQSAVDAWYFQNLCRLHIRDDGLALRHDVDCYCCRWSHSSNMFHLVSCT